MLYTSDVDDEGSDLYVGIYIQPPASEEGKSYKDPEVEASVYSWKVEVSLYT
jgi:hypothetical protein